MRWPSSRPPCRLVGPHGPRGEVRSHFRRRVRAGYELTIRPSAGYCPEACRRSRLPRARAQEAPATEELCQTLLSRRPAAHATGDWRGMTARVGSGFHALAPLLPPTEVSIRQKCTGGKWINIFFVICFERELIRRRPRAAGPEPQAPCRRPRAAGPLPQAPCRRPLAAGPLPQAPSRRPLAASPLPQAPCRKPLAAGPLPQAPSRSRS